jgi:hypothetical protein
MFLINLPTSVSLFITIISASVFSTALYYVLHPFWAKDLSAETQNTAEVVAMRAGVVYAVVIGMMFSNVRMEHFQMVKTMGAEATSLSQLHRALERQGGEGTDVMLEDLVDYTRFVVENQWPALRESRSSWEDHVIAGKTKFSIIWEHYKEIEEKAEDPRFRKLLEKIEYYQILRLTDRQGNLPALFWYIAIFGYLATLATLYVAPPNFRRCVLVSLYSSIVAIVMLGIFVMSHPYSAAADIDPIIFQRLLEVTAQQ